MLSVRILSNHSLDVIKAWKKVRARLWKANTWLFDQPFSQFMLLYCDPPRDFRELGERTQTAFCDTLAR